MEYRIIEKTESFGDSEVEITYTIQKKLFRLFWVGAYVRQSWQGDNSVYLGGRCLVLFNNEDDVKKYFQTFFKEPRVFKYKGNRIIKTWCRGSGVTYVNTSRVTGDYAKNPTYEYHRDLNKLKSDIDNRTLRTKIKVLEM